MNDDATARFDLPMIRPGQAQKESSHNEALALVDLLVQATAVSLGEDVPPAAPAAGEAWIVGSTPVSAWTGKGDQLAGWTDGGWRFAVPIEGMTVWVIEDLEFARYSGGLWIRGEIRGAQLIVAGDRVVGARRAAIAGPANGGTIDAEARAAIAEILATLRGHGLIAT